MKTISLGDDPAPPGQYPISKIVVDSDMDGLTCAAMLKIVYPKAEVFQADSPEMIEGKWDQLLDEHTVTADLHYRPGVGLYFDHHESSKPENSDFPGRWEDSWSAARVVYDYFKDAVDLSKFLEILPDVDLFDTAHISLEQFLHPNDVIKLALSIKRAQSEFNLRLVSYLAAMQNFAEVMSRADVAAKVATMMAERENLFAYISSHSENRGDVVLVDMTGFDADLKTSGYYFNSQFPDSLFNVVVKPGSDGRIKVRLYQNAFNPRANGLNLLPLLARLSDNGGGHPGACGFVGEPGETWADLRARIIRVLDTAHDIIAAD